MEGDTLLMYNAKRKEREAEQLDQARSPDLPPFL
jgi:hypothetical protein